MVEPFVHEQLPGRIVFGNGTSKKIGDEVENLGAKRVVLVSFPLKKDNNFIDSIKGFLVDQIRVTAPHVPIEMVEESKNIVKQTNADCLVAIGGGSSIGLAKALALEFDIPIIAVPTTYAGSEMTPIYGITTGEKKQTGRDIRVLPKTVIYDPELTTTLPPRVASVSAINALAHCIEALYAKNISPTLTVLAEEGIRNIAKALQSVVENPEDTNAQSHVIYGAHLSGSVLAMAGMALHHRICHVIGGMFRASHADIHTVILPQVVRYNMVSAEEPMKRVAKIFGKENAAVAIFDFMKEVGAPLSLKDIGIENIDKLEAVAEAVFDTPFYNPRKTNPKEVLNILHNAYYGVVPG